VDVLSRLPNDVVAAAYDWLGLDAVAYPVVRFGRDERKIDRMRPYLPRQAATRWVGWP